MDPRIIDLYNEELLHLRSEGAEFAREFPDRAGRLSLDASRVEDPYVERLLEGVAFLAARVRLKLEAQYPIFTQQLLEVLFPGWLAPSPSACVLKLAVDATKPQLLQGAEVPSATRVTGALSGNDTVRCDFRTTRALRLWPLTLKRAQYVAAAREVSAPFLGRQKPSSSLHLELEMLGEADLSKLPLDRLPLFVTKPDAYGTQLMELMGGRCLAVSVSTDPSGRQVHAWLDATHVRHLGFDPDEAMFPMPARGHAGFRVLKEYAALPEKFRFVELSGLRPALAGLKGKRLFLTFWFSGAFARLESAVKTDSLALFCVPAVNLREWPLNRIDVAPGQTEFQLIADRMRPLDREIVQVTEVLGGGGGGERRFQPIFEAVAAGKLATASYYTTRRERRMLTKREAREQTVSYPGSEVFISLAEPGAAPYGKDLQYLAVKALCSNRDLPLYLRAQFADASYTLNGTFPVGKIECVAGPSVPLALAIDGYDPWVALSHLFVNNLSLFDEAPDRGGEALRAMLSLYATVPGHFLLRQAEGLMSVTATQVTRRIPGGGPISFGRGVGVELAMSDRAFDGGSPFLLAAVLEHFLAAHVSINSFVETRVELVDRAEHLQWPTRLGRRPSY